MNSERNLKKRKKEEVMNIENIIEWIEENV